MPILVASALALLPATAPAHAIRPGAWDVTSTVVEFSVPGVPGFLQRMARGKTKAENKRLAPRQGVEALLAPDPKANCRIDNQTVAEGRYTQTLTCPQKRGGPMQISRVGTYDATGFVGRATVTGAVQGGTLTIVLDQRALRVRP